jgi:NADH dehydrogenase
MARVQAFMLEILPGPTLMSRDNLDSMKQDNIASGQHPLPPHWQPMPLEAIAPEYLHPST